MERGSGLGLNGPRGPCMIDRVMSYDGWIRVRMCCGAVNSKAERLDFSGFCFSVLLRI